MKFLESNEIAQWCGQHGFAVDGNGLPLRAAPTRTVTRRAYASGRRSGLEAEIAVQVTHGLGSWTECLLVPLTWGVWPSGEDWPSFYAARGARGERRSLETAPGHLFVEGEREDLVSFLVMAMQNAWDTVVLPAQGNEPGGVRAWVSHDEWVELQAWMAPGQSG